MADIIGKTNQELNNEYFKKIGEQVAKRQQESAERFTKLSNGLGTAFSKKYVLSELTATAQGIIDGKVEPKKMGTDWCIEFTEKCKLAIKDLELKKQEYKTSAGMAYLQNRLDSYKKQQQEYEAVDATISLLRTFI